MPSPAVLQVQIRALKVFLAGRALEVVEREVRLLALLGLIHPSVKVLEGDGWISVDQIGQLQGYHTLKSDALRTTIRSFVRNLEELNVNLVVSPKGKRREFFKLDEQAVKEVIFDREVAEVQEWLGLDTVRGSATPDPRLLLAEALYQAGKFGQAESLLQEQIDNSPIQESVFAALLLLSQIRTHQNRLEEAWELLRRAEDSAVYARGDARPLVQLWQVQLHRLEGDLEEAQAILQTLRRKAQTYSPLSLCRLDTLAGLLLLDEKQREPQEAMRLFERALQGYAQIGGWWGVQASYANLGLACWHQAQRTYPVKRTEWLNQAKNWFQTSHNFCKQTGFAYETPEILLYLARCKRALGEWEGQTEVLAEAQALATTLGLTRSQAEVCYEQGELFWFRGEHGTARTWWEQALELAGEDERVFLLEQIGSRLG